MSTEPAKRGRGRPRKPPGEKVIRRKITRPVDPEDVRWFQVECDSKHLTGPQLFRAMRIAYEVYSAETAIEETP